MSEWSDTFNTIGEIFKTLWDVFKTVWELVKTIFIALLPVFKFVVYILQIIGWFLENFGNFFFLIFTIISDFFKAFSERLKFVVDKFLELINIPLNALNKLIKYIQFAIGFILSMVFFLFNAGNYGKDDAILYNDQDEATKNAEDSKKITFFWKDY